MISTMSSSRVGRQNPVPHISYLFFSLCISGSLLSNVEFLSDSGRFIFFGVDFQHSDKTCGSMPLKQSVRKSHDPNIDNLSRNGEAVLPPQFFSNYRDMSFSSGGTPRNEAQSIIHHHCPPPSDVHIQIALVVQ